MDILDLSHRLISGLNDQIVGVMWSGGKSSSVLWDIAQAELSDAQPVFVDHGRHAPETHDLLRTMHNDDKFMPNILINKDAINYCLEHGKLPGNVEYDIHDFHVFKMLYDDIINEIVPYQYEVILTGDRIGRTRDGEHLPIISTDYRSLSGDAVITVRPLLYWTEQQIWQYIASNDVPFNRRYELGYRIVDFTDDEKSGTMPAWKYETEYNRTEDKIDKLIRDNPIS